MQKTLISISIFLFSTLYIHANGQVTENFNDTNFSTNPTWTGNINDWTVTIDGQLQSNNTTAKSTFYLSTPNSLATSAQWEFSVQLAFNTSSANYVDAYLTASAPNLTDSNTVGYFVRLGSTDDDICLYRKDVQGKMTRIIDGIDGVLNTSNNRMTIKVICNAAKQWTLFRDLTGSGTNYVSEGVTTDPAYQTSAYFGFIVKQSTASFFKKHFFDNIHINPFVPDVDPPAIQSLRTVSANSIDILFSEAIDSTTAQTPSNYSVNNGIGNPAIAAADHGNKTLVHLTFATTFAANKTHTITINNVKDLAGNALAADTATFSFDIPQAFDVVIDEILADPVPVVGLPNAEFIEVKNISTKEIDLAGWKFANSTTVSAAFPSFKLAPDSFLIITASSHPGLFTQYGKVMGISSFPSLDNNGTTLSLISKEGITIHSVAYKNNWFQSDVKSDGGYSLEMIDTHNPCSGANNWKASSDATGGTPGAKNSLDAINPDNTAPALLRAAAIDSVTIMLTYSEPVDSAKGANIANYSLPDGVTPVAAFTIPPTFDKVQLIVGKPVTPNKTYTITANNITDCSGNMIQAVNTARFGLASAIDSNNIVINEILFNPKPGAVDYVEIYNRSSKIFDLKDLQIATRSSTTNALRSVTQLSKENNLLFPGDFFVISENSSVVKQNYYAKNPDNFIDINMPSFGNEEAVVVLLNRQGNVIDEVHYNSKWHFALIDNEKGISLERIDYNKPSQNKDNWTSAASTAGFGTPSYQNSQFGADASVKAEITVTPKTFSPDKDGFEDFTTINYKMTEPGYVANITIFDAAGRPVKSLAKNATLALSGTFRWDGLDDKSNKLVIGTYVIYTEVFNLNGKKKSFRNAVILATRR